MFSRFRIAIGLALLLSLAIIVPSFAGGWAVITLDELPADVVAGEPLTIGFTVRQHGQTRMDGLYPTVTAVLLDDEFVVRAEPDGEPGHYTATLTFPTAGAWSWSIQAFTMDQPLPALRVAASGAGSSAPGSEPAGAAAPVLLTLRVLAFGVGLAGLVLAYQRNSRLALGLTVLGLAVGLASLMSGSAIPSVEAQSKAAPDSPAISQVELGRQLFIAKGCITCHYNSQAADRSEYHTIEIGAPDLSNYSSHPDVLFIRLKDPAAAKSDTKMPNLGLKETEIQALIAFINSK